MMNDEEREEQRRIDDDYNVVNHYYAAKRMHPNIPFIFKMKWEILMSLSGI